MHPEKRALPRLSMLALVWFLIATIIYAADKGNSINLRFYSLLLEPWRMLLSPLAVQSLWQLLLVFFIVFVYFGKGLERRWGSVRFLYHFVVLSFLLNFGEYFLFFYFKFIHLL